MAAIFNDFVIGGQDGRPFPNYSISSESVLSDDETIIGIKFSIKITGQIIAVGDMEIEDGTGIGVRQNNLHGQINSFLEKARAGTQSGRLEIDPYGGLPNKIEFLSARLISVEIPDQDEESSGVLYSNYSLTFEAYENTSFEFSILSAEETWETATEETTTHFPNANGDIYKTYTVTHTISAKGRKMYEDGQSGQDAWENAKDFVNSRLVSSPEPVNGGLFGGHTGTYNPLIIEDGGPDISDYSFYNHIRIPSCGIGDGSYSITDTWVACKQPAIIDMENTQEIDSGGLVTITVSGSITGLNEEGADNNIISRIQNAEQALQYIEANAFNIAKLSFDEILLDCSSPLSRYLSSKSIGKNKGSGIITFSYSYNNSSFPSELLDGDKPMVSSYSLSITDENEDGKNNIVAILPIILKANGPEIQDMGTTDVRKRIFQLDMAMGGCYRQSKPFALIEPTLNSNKPSATNVYRESKGETWNPVTGEYSLSITWVY
jgi:hypothetical protein